MMRRRGPGLVGTMARTAVIAGTASATVGAMENRRARKNQAAQQEVDQQQQMADMQAQMNQMQAAQAPPPPAMPAAAPAGGTDVVAELQKLADLKAQGILNDEQFEAAKAKLLGA
jgi:hypothetical protein